MRFNQHGNFNIEFKGNILIVHAFGAWNKETAVSFANQSEMLIKTVSGLSSWAILADVKYVIPLYFCIDDFVVMPKR
jgi:hypothetical protein